MAINSAAGYPADLITYTSNAVFDHYVNMGQDAIQQHIQKKPLLRIMEAAKKSYPAGKEFIYIQLQGRTGNNGVNDQIRGFGYMDTVGFYNPTNLDRAAYVWREHHLGMEVSEGELKGSGILVSDGNSRAPVDKRRLREVITPIVSNKTKDLTEQWMDSMQTLLWDDGTADPMALSGIRSIITDVPTTGVVGGINRATAANWWWRNRAYTAAAYAANGSAPGAYGGNKITASASNGGALLGVLQADHRQLRRYGGEPNRFIAGSDFIGAYELEIRANGSYSDSGFTGRQDGAMGEIYFKGIPIEYDPYLDDLGRSKFAYFFSDKDICIHHLEGDWMRPRTPTRPYNQFVFHKSLLATGQVTASRCNSAAVYEIN